MADIIRFAPTPHDEVQLLVPWYVNGTLDSRETARVEAHLGECASCRLDVETEYILRQEVACFSAYEALEPRPPAVAAERPHKINLPSFLKRRVAVGWLLAGQLATAAALLMIVLLPASTPGEPDASYQALGSSSEASGNIVIMFDPARSERETRSVLLRSKAEIVAGPNVSGAYVLSVPDVRRSQVLEGLRANRAVILAEPMDSGSSG